MVILNFDTYVWTDIIREGLPRYRGYHDEDVPKSADIKPVEATSS